MRGLYLVFILLFALTGTSLAETYYVDATNGDDGNNGLFPTDQGGGNAPWQKWNHPLQPGDVVCLKRGEVWYATGPATGTFSVAYSGEEGAPITFTAYGEGERPILDGQYDPTPLFADNRILMNSHSYITIEHLHVRNCKKLGVYGPAGSTNIIFEDCVFEDIGRTVTDGTLGSAVSFTGASNLTFIDCTVTKTRLHGIYITGTSNITVINPTISDCQRSGIRIQGTITDGEYDRSNATVNGGEVFWCGDGVYFIRFKDFSITGMSIHDNTVTEGVGEEGYGIGIQSCRSYTINRNIIYDNRTDGIEAWSSEAEQCVGGTISRNEVSGHTAGGCYGIQVSHDWVHGTKVFANIVYGNNVGIGLCGSGDGSRCYNNTLYNNVTGIGVFSGESGWEIKNNILFENTSYQVETLNGSADPTFTHEYNLYYDSGLDPEIEWGATTYTIAQATIFEATAQNTDPCLSDPANGDFSLLSPSPCIDTGTNVGLSEDFIGTPLPQRNGFDIGALEYVVSMGAIVPILNLLLLAVT